MPRIGITIKNRQPTISKVKNQGMFYHDQKRANDLNRREGFELNSEKFTSENQISGL